MQPITATELEILKLLWQRMPQTGRELHDQLALSLAWSYSSTRKTLERMVEKKLLLQESQGHQNSFRANVDKISTLANLTADFAKRVLELDSPLPLAMFSDSKLLSQSEQHALHEQLALLQDEQQDEQQDELRDELHKQQPDNHATDINTLVTRLDASADTTCQLTSTATLQNPTTEHTDQDSDPLTRQPHGAAHD